MCVCNVRVVFVCVVCVCVVCMCVCNVRVVFVCVVCVCVVYVRVVFAWCEQARVCVWCVCVLVCGMCVPRPLLFLPSVCVHNNTRNWKISGKLKLVFTPVYCYEHKRNVKMGEAWEQGYAWCMCVYDHVHVCVYKWRRLYNNYLGDAVPPKIVFVLFFWLFFFLVWFFSSWYVLECLTF